MKGVQAAKRASVGNQAAVALCFFLQKSVENGIDSIGN
jgi:hypothetical protein